MATAEPLHDAEPTIVRKGWCEKHGKKGLRHVWKRRLLILLTNHELAYFENENHDHQREVDLVGASDIEAVPDHDDHQFCFDILFGDQRLQFAVDDDQDRNEWIFVIRSAIREVKEELAEQEAQELAAEAARRAMSAEPPPLPKRRQSWWNRAKDTDASGIEHVSPSRRKSLVNPFARRQSSARKAPLESPVTEDDSRDDSLDDGNLRISESASGSGNQNAAGGIISSFVRALSPEPSGDEGGGYNSDQPVIAPPKKKRPHRRTFSLLRGKSSGNRSHTPDPQFTVDDAGTTDLDDTNSKAKRRFSGMFRSRTPEPKKTVPHEETIAEAKAREDETYEQPMTVPMNKPRQARASVTLQDFMIQVESSGAAVDATNVEPIDGMDGTVSKRRRLSDYFRGGGFGAAVDEIKMSPNELQTLVEEFDEEQTELKVESSMLKDNFVQAESKRQKSEKLVETLKRQLESQRNELEKLREKSVESDRLVNQLRSDKTKMEEHARDMESRLEELDAQTQTCRERCDSALKHENEMKEEVSRFQEKVRAQAELLASEKQAHSTDLQQAQEQINRLQSEMKILRQVSSDAQSHEAQFTHLQMENTHLRSQLREVQLDFNSQLDLKNQRINDLNEKIQDLNGRLLSRENKASASLTLGNSEPVESELMFQLESLQTENRRLRSEEDSFQSRIQTLERDVSRAESDSLRHQNDLIEVQAKVTVMDESIKAREIAWQRIERETRAENEELKSQCERYEREMSKLKKSVHSATRKYKHLRHQSSVDNMSLRTELHVAQQERRRHQRMESVEMDSINKLTIEAEHLRAEKRRLEARLKELQGDLVKKQDLWHRVWRELSDENEQLKNGRPSRSHRPGAQSEIPVRNVDMRNYRV